MPALTIGTNLSAIIVRQARAARSKDLREVVAVTRHAAENAMIPVVTILGLQLGHIFGGAAISEVILAVPGVGRMVVDSIFLRDNPAAGGAVLIMVVIVLIINFLTDMVYGSLDPRIRYS